MICNKFHIFAVKIVSLKERNTFYIPFPTGISYRREGLCRGWTLKDEIDDHCSRNSRKVTDIQTDIEIGMSYKYNLLPKYMSIKGWQTNRTIKPSRGM